MEFKVGDYVVHKGSPILRGYVFKVTLYFTHFVYHNDRLAYSHKELRKLTKLEEALK